MDMQKIGEFLRELRKERGLTQEQLGEILNVATRTVSRWETASNMPDLSTIIQIAEFFNVEVKEILNGGRDSEKINPMLKETLEKVADYNKSEKEKTAKIFLASFLITIIVGVIALSIQLLMFLNFRYIIGETIVLLVGSITAIFMTVKNGLWTKSDGKSNAINDLIISGVMSIIFSCVAAFLIYKFMCNMAITIIGAVGFFFVIFIIGVVVLRMLAYFSNKKRNNLSD